MRLGQGSALASVLVIAACGGDEFGGFAGRLAPVGYSDGHGAVRVVTTRDRVLDLDCAVMKDEAGNLRCLPRSTFTNAFADPDCSQPLADLAGEPPRFVSILPSGPGTLGAVAYELRGRHGGEVYVSTDEGCMKRRSSSLSSVGGSTGVLGVPGQPPAAATYYALSHVEPRIFAAVSPRRDAVSGGVDRITYVGEDGSEVFGTLEDRRWGRPCAAQWIELDGDLVCGPNTFVFTRAFASDTCDGDVLAVDAPASLTSAHVWTSPDFCGLSSLAELGRPIEPEATYYTRVFGGECHAADEPSETSGGLAIPPQSLEGLREARVVDPLTILPSLEYTDEGEGRLVARHVSTSRVGVVHRNTPVFYDRELGARCSPEPRGEEPRCVPLAYGFFDTFFRDAECRVPVRVVNDVPGYQIHHAQDLDGTFYALTDERLEDVYFGGPGACVGSGLTLGGIRCGTWRVVGETIDDDFAEMKYGPLNKR